MGLGQLALIQEDINSAYYRVLLSLSIAQGLSLPEPQSCLLFSESSFLPLPKPLTFKGESAPSEEQTADSGSQEKMKIAWRYDANLKERSDPSGVFHSSIMYNKLLMKGRRQPQSPV